MGNKKKQKNKNKNKNKNLNSNSNQGKEKEKKRNKRSYESSLLLIKKFKAQLSELGLRINEVGGDGNCFFRSFSDQMEGTESSHLNYREMACDYIEENKEFIKFFIEDDQTIDDYIKEMRKSGTWGGNIEVYSLSMLLNVNFYIFLYNRPLYIVKNHDIPIRNIYLSYHEGNHYNSVRLIDDFSQDEQPPEIPLSILTGVEQTNDANALQDIDDDELDEELENELENEKAEEEETKNEKKKEENNTNKNLNENPEKEEDDFLFYYKDIKIMSFTVLEKLKEKENEKIKNKREENAFIYSDDEFKNESNNKNPSKKEKNKNKGKNGKKPKANNKNLKEEKEEEMRKKQENELLNEINNDINSELSLVNQILNRDGIFYKETNNKRNKSELVKTYDGYNDVRGELDEVTGIFYCNMDELFEKFSDEISKMEENEIEKIKSEKIKSKKSKNEKLEKIDSKVENITKKVELIYI